MYALQFLMLSHFVLVIFCDAKNGKERRDQARIINWLNKPLIVNNAAEASFSGCTIMRRDSTPIGS